MRLTPGGVLIAAAGLASVVMTVGTIGLLHQALFVRLGLPLYTLDHAIEGWGAHALWLGLLGLVALTVASSDPWLGALVGYLALTVFWRGAAVDLDATLIVALAALGLVMLRHVGPEGRERARRWLAVAGLVQAGVVLANWIGYVPTEVLLGVQPITGRVVGGMEPRGLLGNVDITACFIAMTAPLMPLPALPVAVAAVGVTHSLSGGAALAVGLAWRLPRRLRYLALGVGGALVTLLGQLRPLGLASSRLRAEVWTLGLMDWFGANPLFGLGLGAWSQRIPTHQQALLARGVRVGWVGAGLWYQAHNEPLQMLYETGLVGLALVAGWGWSQRTALGTPRFGAALLAVVTASLIQFPLHLVATGLLALVILGLALPSAPLLTQGA